MDRKIGIQFLIFSVLFLGAAWADGADVYLDISAAGSGKIEVAIPDFTVAEDHSQGAYLFLTSTMSKVVRDDLEFSGFFKVIEKGQFVQEQEREDRAKGEVNFREWRALGALALVKGNISMGDRRLVLESELYDVEKGKRIIGVEFSGELRSYRAVAHRLSEEIIYRLTGEKGVSRTKISFISRRGENKELFVMDYDGQNVFPLTLDKSIAVQPAWSPNGKQIAFTSYVDRNPDLYVIDADGSRRRPLSLAQGLNAGAAWSPDGKRVALVMSKDGNPEIYVLDVRSGEAKRLTHDRAIDSAPAWSPDGQRIAFTSGKSGSPQIYVMDANGGNVTQLTYVGDYNDQAAWSPRGDRLAFTGRKGGRFDIYTVNPDGSDLKRLTANAGDNEAAAWSPDGRHIVFTSDRYGVPQIYVMGADGSGQRPVTRLAGGGYSPAWSPRLED